MDKVHVKSADCRNAICQSLEVNLDACKIISSFQGTSGMHPQAHTVDIANQSNHFLLHDPEEIENHFDLSKEENSIFVKQHSALWHQMCDSTLVAGSTLGKVIVYETLKLQKEYYAVKVKKQQPKHVSEEVQNFLDYRITNEVKEACLNFAR